MGRRGGGRGGRGRGGGKGGRGGGRGGAGRRSSSSSSGGGGKGHRSGGGGGGGYGSGRDALDGNAGSAHWLKPCPRTLKKVPLAFDSPFHFATIIANNLLAEFFYIVKEGRTKGKRLSASEVSSKDLIIRDVRK
eukprot:gene17919-21996_t